jgi:hypothetical protein
MRTTTFVTLLITGFLSLSLFANRQDRAAKGSPLSQPRNTNQSTDMAARGIDFRGTGTVLAVLLNGTQANLTGAVLFKNTFPGGQVVAGRLSTLSKDIDSPTVPSKTISRDEE